MPVFTVSMGTWDNGTPVTVWQDTCESFQDGHDRLWRIGHSRDYSNAYAGYLAADGVTLAILNIYGSDRWGIDILPAADAYR